MSPNRLDELSVSIGAIKQSVEDLKSRAAEDREIQAARHADNQSAIRKMEHNSATRNNETRTAIETLKQELKSHAINFQGIQPQIAALQVSRSRMAVLASIGLLVLWGVGRGIESGLGWALEKILRMKFGG